MRYYTKEWYSWLQEANLTTGMKKIPDKDYTDEDIQELYDRALRQSIKEAEAAYNSPPVSLLDLINPNEETYNPEDFLLINEETGEATPIPTLEEAREIFRNDLSGQQKEFNNRPPFDPAETIEFFEESYQFLLDSSSDFWKQTGFHVNPRLLALDLLPETVYKALKEREKSAKKALNETEKKAKQAMLREEKQLPEEIRDIFCYHDAEILSIAQVGSDIYMDLKKDFDFDDANPYERVVFKDANFIEKDPGLDSDAFYLYDELYKTEHGYEYHLMATGEDLGYVTIECRDIQAFPTEKPMATHT